MCADSIKPIRDTQNLYFHINCVNAMHIVAKNIVYYFLSHYKILFVEAGIWESCYPGHMYEVYKYI